MLVLWRTSFYGQSEMNKEKKDFVCFKKSNEQNEGHEQA